MKKTLLSLAFVLIALGASAAEALYTLGFGGNYADNQQSNSAYTGTWTYSLGDNKWDITAFNNNKNGWADEIRCGRKSDASVASIATAFAIPEEITSIVINFKTFAKADKVSSVKLETSTSADFATIAETVALPSADYSAGEKTFTLSAPAKKLYYRIVFDMQATGQNGNIAVSSLVFNGNSNIDPGKQMPELSFGEVTDFTVIFGNAFTAPTLTKATTAAAVYSSSNEAVATVNSTSGEVTIKAAGVTVITASCNANEAFNEGTATYTLNVVEEVADIAAFLAKKDAENPVIIKGDVSVIYQIGLNLFVQDNSGRMLVYGTVDQTYKSGDVIPGGFQGLYAEYGKNPQLTQPVGFKAATGNNGIKPTEVSTLGQFNNESALAYLVINNLEISTISSKNITFKLGEDNLTGYNQFGLKLPTDYDGKKYNVTGIKSSYNGNVQFQPVLIEEADGSGIDDIVVDENAPVEYFNLQGVRVENPENGLFIRRQGGKVSKVIIR